MCENIHLNTKNSWNDWILHLTSLFHLLKYVLFLHRKIKFQLLSSAVDRHFFFDFHGDAAIFDDHQTFRNIDQHIGFFLGI